MISEMCVKYGSSGVKGQRPLRFLGNTKGAHSYAKHRGDHPIGLPPNGSTESLPARPKINSVRAKVLPAAKRLYAALAAYVELA